MDTKISFGFYIKFIISYNIAATIRFMKDQHPHDYTQIIGVYWKWLPNSAIRDSVTKKT